MPTEIHQKILVTEVVLDFGVSQAELNSLPAGDIAWCAKVTTMEDCDYAEVFAQITVGATSPEGTIEYYVARHGTNLEVGTHHIDLSDHGNEGTANDITDLIADLGGPVKVVGATTATASIVYTHSFRVYNPGGSFTIFCYNNTDEAFAASGNDAYVRGWGPESQ